ncbi:lasso RiPP family leader peptide-containing protein [Qaidamihabitans albus]|nr:lasso RiPP family leader peptide-containing protein [Qaidamihabitans albus]
MRQPYEAPELTTLGSVTELTQANLFGSQPDNLTWLVPIVGDRDGFS